MKMRKLIALILTLLLTLAFVGNALAMDSFYVKTANGKGLNLRSEPSRGNNIILSIP